jgi:hypothetical protein
MPTATEIWYVRLPSGRTIRARTADVLRRHLRAGRIPPESRARRSGEKTWQPLARIAAFADAMPPKRRAPAVKRAAVKRAATRPASGNGSESRPLGVRGLIGELLGALDSTLNRTKLTIGALTGIGLAIGWIAFELAAELPAGLESVAGYTTLSLFVLAVVALASVLLTRITVIELDRHRRAQGAELVAGLWGNFLRVLVAQGLVAGAMIGLLLGVRAAIPWLAASDFGDVSWLRDGFGAALAVLRVLLEVLCLPVLGLAVVQLGPLLVIEEHSLWTSLCAWAGMLRRHLARIYLYEALALMPALVLALPMLALLGVAGYSIGDTMSVLERDTLLILGGVALTPMIAYLIVANVFIYINLRYEFYFSARQQ